MKIVTVEEMIALEQQSAKVGALPEFLMENAGLATAEYARDILGDIQGRSITILVGPGNNGGDGLVAARHLHDWGAKVVLYLVKRQTENDRNFDLDVERSIPYIDALAEGGVFKFRQRLSETDLFIDSLFGTGRIRPFEGIVKELLESVAEEKAGRPSMQILAVDLPSGLDADTGAVDPATVGADLTITFACPKIGLYKFPGAAYLGQLAIADIRIPEYLSDHIKTELITPELVRSLLPPRPLHANKGTFGKLMVIAGSTQYIGAASLACEGAMRVGAGLVMLATPKSVYRLVAGKSTECTYLPLEEDTEGYLGASAMPAIREKLGNYDAVLLGCGMGQNLTTAQFVSDILKELSDKPLVLDADGLNNLSSMEDWAGRLKASSVITPHPGEMARLCGKTIPDIQQSRFETALAFAQKWHQTIVLKGAFTVAASPEGSARINPVANPGMASAGMGDVLSGVIAGLIVQGLAPFDAATCGVYIHAMAGEMVRMEIGDAGMIASDILPVLPMVIHDLKQEVAGARWFVT